MDTCLPPGAEHTAVTLIPDEVRKKKGQDGALRDQPSNRNLAGVDSGKAIMGESVM